MMNLIRDPKSLAILNTDADAYKNYIQKRSETVRIESLNNDVNQLKDELSEIKGLLLHLINGKNNG